jgi:hypothetical protein
MDAFEIYFCIFLCKSILGQVNISYGFNFQS